MPTQSVPPTAKGLIVLICILISETWQSLVVDERAPRLLVDCSARNIHRNCVSLLILLLDHWEGWLILSVWSTTETLPIILEVDGTRARLQVKCVVWLPHVARHLLHRITQINRFWAVRWWLDMWLGSHVVLTMLNWNRLPQAMRHTCKSRAALNIHHLVLCNILECKAPIHSCLVYNRHRRLVPTITSLSIISLSTLIEANIALSWLNEPCIGSILPWKLCRGIVSCRCVSAVKPWRYLFIFVQACLTVTLLHTCHVRRLLGLFGHRRWVLAVDNTASKLAEFCFSHHRRWFTDLRLLWYCFPRVTIERASFRVVYYWSFAALRLH